MGACEKRFLFIASAVLSTLAFFLLCVAISGDKWVYCFEKMSENPDNRTERYRNYYMGLWYVCENEHVVSADMNADNRWGIILARDVPFDCWNIPYFISDDAFDTGNTLSMIQKSIRKSTMFPFLSLAVLAMGAVVTLCGHCKNKGKKPLNFFSGIVFVCAGLLNLCGVIVFIASVTEEVGHKARQPRDDPALRYSYGWSIALSAFSFSLMEFAGAMFVYIYIKRFKMSFEKKQEHLKMVVEGSRSPPLLPPPPPPFSSRADRVDPNPNYEMTNFDGTIGGKPVVFKSGYMSCHGDRQASASASSSPGNYHPYHQRATSIVSRSLSRSQDFLNTLEGGRYDRYEPSSRHASLSRGYRLEDRPESRLDRLDDRMHRLEGPVDADYKFVSREVSRNTLSTNADYTKDFSYDTLHRTTPI